MGDPYGVVSAGEPAAPGPGIREPVPPVFADLSGRRARRMKVAGVAAGALLFTFLVIMASGMLGGPRASFLPWGDPRSSAPGAAHLASPGGVAEKAGLSPVPAATVLPSPRAAQGPTPGSAAPPAAASTKATTPAAAATSAPVVTNRASKTPPGQNRTSTPHPSGRPSAP